MGLTLGCRSSIETRIEALRSGGDVQAVRAADELAEMGPRAAPATGALIEALDHPNCQVRAHADVAMDRGSALMT